MSTINDGGPAFPVTELNKQGEQELTHPGMSLRAYFAAKALPAVYMDFWQHARDRELNVPSGWQDRIAQECVDIADAMIVALEMEGKIDE